MFQDEFCHIHSTHAFEGLDVIDAQFTDTVFGKHAHSEYVISIVDRGIKQFYHKGKTHNAGAGDISIVSPDEIHTGNKGHADGWKYRAIYPTEQQIKDIYYEVYGQNGLPTFKDSVIQNPRLEQQMQLLLSKIQNTDALLESEVHLELLLVKMMLQYGSVKRTPAHNGQALSNVLLARDFLADNYRERVPLDNLANLAGVSKYHLINEFKRHFGLTPHQYQIQQRLSHSKTLLKSGAKPVEIAMHCGFHDQSHFHKAFVSSMGVTPTIYQQQFFTR